MINQRKAQGMVQPNFQTMDQVNTQTMRNQYNKNYKDQNIRSKFKKILFVPKPNTNFSIERISKIKCNEY